MGSGEWGLGSRVVLDFLPPNTLVFPPDGLSHNSVGGFGGEGFDSLTFPDSRLPHAGSVG